MPLGFKEIWNYECICHMFSQSTILMIAPIYSVSGACTKCGHPASCIVINKKVWLDFRYMVKIMI